MRLNEEQLAAAIDKTGFQDPAPRGEQVMSDYCSVHGAACERPRASGPGLCPQCGKKGQSVSTLTVKSLVRDHTRVSATASYAFCHAPECDVVYFAEDHVFSKPDVKVRVGLKEREDPIPLCYCFGYSRADVRRQMEERGRTDLLQRVKAEVEAGFCACEVKNPSGACCLGDITRAVQGMKALATQNA